MMLVLFTNNYSKTVQCVWLNTIREGIILLLLLYQLLHNILPGNKHVSVLKQNKNIYIVLRKNQFKFNKRLLDLLLLSQKVVHVIKTNNTNSQLSLLQRYCTGAHFLYVRPMHGPQLSRTLDFVAKKKPSPTASQSHSVNFYSDQCNALISCLQLCQHFTFV